MDKPHNQARIVTIHQMLFEMARGNFNSCIPLTTYGDELETISVLINMVAEEMKESIFMSGFINARSLQPTIVGNLYTLLLDKEFVVKSFSPEILTFLGFVENEFIDVNLSSFISTASMQQFCRLCDDDQFSATTLQLQFVSKEDLNFTLTCEIRRLNNLIELLLPIEMLSNQYNYYPLVKDNNAQNHHKTIKVDAFLIQKLYDYIIANLEEPLPSLPILARKFSTNEHKLKAGFRHFFKTSIYKFYNEERLKRAHFMIEHTAIPLKNISVMNGFNDYPNFSKSFKNRFGFSPFELKRKETDFIPVEKDLT